MCSSTIRWRPPWRTRPGESSRKTAASTTVLELAETIWRKINGDKPFEFVSDPPFEHDVQMRVPDVRKAKQVLGFEATTTLSAMLDEVIPWIRAELDAGRV